MELSARFTEALVYATELHSQQMRKGSGIPYVAHLLGVASIVLEYGGNEDEAIAALLHDAIEDQGGVATREEILVRFGEVVTQIVDGCTDTDTIPKPPWRDRKQAYIDRLSYQSASVHLVSAADKLYNARSLLKDYRLVGEQLWERFRGKKEGTLWYYRSLVEAFTASGTTPIVTELQKVVAELENLVQG